ncbi:MAG: N-formylglutamate amidohydrolase [Myxococcota bacterium]
MGEAAEVWAGADRAPVVLTCEHASQRLPDPWRWPAADLRLVGTHWAFDLGAAALTRDLAQALWAPAVLSRFTRLLVDANRDAHEESLVLSRAEGGPVALNAGMGPEDRARRLEVYWDGYHRAVDGTVARASGDVILSVHTFTPVYEGRCRALEVGVLFDEEEALAARVAEAVGQVGFRVALNEPYSGKEGLIYAADRHARRHGRRALEIEMRQDLAVRPQARARLVDALRRALA